MGRCQAPPGPRRRRPPRRPEESHPSRRLPAGCGSRPHAGGRTRAGGDDSSESGAGRRDRPLTTSHVRGCPAPGRRRAPPRRARVEGDGLPARVSVSSDRPRGGRRSGTRPRMAASSRPASRMRCRARRCQPCLPGDDADGARGDGEPADGGHRLGGSARAAASMASATSAAAVRASRRSSMETSPEWPAWPSMRQLEPAGGGHPRDHPELAQSRRCATWTSAWARSRSVGGAIRGSSANACRYAPCASAALVPAASCSRVRAGGRGFQRAAVSRSSRRRSAAPPRRRR